LTSALDLTGSVICSRTPRPGWHRSAPSRPWRYAPSPPTRPSIAGRPARSCGSSSRSTGLPAQRRGGGSAPRATCSTVIVFSLSVSAYVGAPPSRSQRGIQAAEQDRQGAVPGRDHHPEPRPGQPHTEQHRGPRADPRGPGPSRTAATTSCSHTTRTTTGTGLAECVLGHLRLEGVEDAQAPGLPRRRRLDVPHPASVEQMFGCV
jgi:hypothetical protein